MTSTIADRIKDIAREVRWLGGDDNDPARIAIFNTLYDIGQEVEALTAERDALRAALKPFADNAEVWEENESHFTVVYCRRGVKDKPDLKITVGDLLAARYILSKVEGRVLGEGSDGN